MSDFENSESTQSGQASAHSNGANQTSQTSQSSQSSLVRKRAVDLPMVAFHGLAKESMDAAAATAKPIATATAAV
jgi:hypothetical protein